MPGHHTPGDARIGGGFILEQNEGGGHCRLAAEGLSVSRDVALNMAGTVNLRRAKIKGDLTLHLNRLKGDDSAAAADLSGVTAEELTLIGRPRMGFLDLTRASVSLLRDSPQDWPDGSRIVLDGFEYRDLRGDRSRRNHDSYRLQWLKTGTRWVREAEGQYEDVGFTPQPFQQLAAVYRNAGKDGQAARVLHKLRSQQNMQLSWRENPAMKLWNTFLNVFIGYGYAPGVALAWIALLVVFNTFWFSRFNPHVGMVRATVRTVGTMFPAVGLERWPWAHMSSAAYLLAAELPLYGLLLGGLLIGVFGRALGR